MLAISTMRSESVEHNHVKIVSVVSVDYFFSRIGEEKKQAYLCQITDEINLLFQ